MPTTYTPIRYPGGKSQIYPLIKSIIDLNGLNSCTYAEAFCGGAGLALKLLLKGDVSRIILNDLDPAVYSMWDAIVKHPDELCTFLMNTKPTIEEWERQHEILIGTDEPSLELGKASFFLNRTNHSGILRGGPIGGRNQIGAWHIDARYRPKTLCEKIRRIAERAEHIELHNMDALVFVDNVLKPRATNNELLFANFDPPYVKKGPQLYKNSFHEEDHRTLAKTIISCKFPWIITYDSVELIEELYGNFNCHQLEVSYSAAKIRREHETLILGPSIMVPENPLLVTGY